MSRFFAASLVCLLLCAPLPGHADSIELRELRELRQIVEQQSKQLETLAQQVAKLNEALGHQKAAAAAEAPATPANSAPPATPATAAPAAPAPEAPRAEAVPKHTVAKGETLTSIAKLYNITVSELQKLNKIENDRKLQIGQTLTIPTPKPPEPPSDKKENP
jgi:LysM repeat protein